MVEVPLCGTTSKAGGGVVRNIFGYPGWDQVPMSQDFVIGFQYHNVLESLNFFRVVMNEHI